MSCKSQLLLLYYSIISLFLSLKPNSQFHLTTTSTTAMNSLSSKRKTISDLLLSLSSPSKPFLCISLFSTSSSSSSSHRSLPSYSSSSRRHDEDSRNVRVSVWWDIENCCVPTGINVFKIAQSITAAVRVNGIKGPVQISAFGDVLCLSRPNQEALSCTGINLIHVPHGGRNSADRSLLVDLMCWVSQNPPPAHIFLISSDKDFSSTLHRLRMNNYNILLAGKDGNNTPGVLCSAASIMWHWNQLAKGESLSGTHFNQPPDGPFNSWYGHYREHLEDPFDVPEHQNTSRAMNDSSNAELLSDKPQPVPKAVLKQIWQIVNSYPHGLSIRELRVQVARNNVNLDKNLYGYKKFSCFLLSMPQIIKVESFADGQFFLRPVSRKVPDLLEGDDISAGPTTENGSRDAQVKRKERSENHSTTRMVDVEQRSPMISNDDIKEKTVEAKVDSITRMVDVEPRSPMISNDDIREKTVEAKVEDIPDNKTSGAKETIDSQVLESPVSPTEELDAKNEPGPFRRLWRKCFSSSIEAENTTLDSPDKFQTASVSQEQSISEQVDVCDPSDSSSSLDDKRDINGKSKGNLGFVTKVLSWFESWKNETPLNTPSEQSTEEPSSIEDSRKLEDGPHSMKLEDAPNTMKVEDAPQLRKHEQFSKETFWNSFESFLRTYRGSDIVLNSPSREQLAKRLKIDGPLVLRSLKETDLLQLVDLLVSDKKWVKEFPTRIPHFRIDLPSGKSSTNVQAHNSNGLSSLFLSSSPEKPGISSVVHKKPSEKSRNETLSDCQKLLDELLQQYPEGFNLGLFKKQFLEKYGYTLEYHKLGYPKLVSLLQIMPGVKIESSNILPDSLVYAPGIESLGSKEKPAGSGSDSEMTDLPLKDEVVESPWEELGPVENSNLRKQEEESSVRRVNNEFEPSLLEDDDEFSDMEEDKSSTLNKTEEKNRSRVNEEDSSLLQILNTWYGTKEETNSRNHGSNPEGLVDCSKEETGDSGSSAIGVKSEASLKANAVRKPRLQKSYTFVSDSLDSNKDKLIDGILGSLKKSGESRMQS